MKTGTTNSSSMVVLEDFCALVSGTEDLRLTWAPDSVEVEGWKEVAVSGRLVRADGLAGEVDVPISSCASSLMVTIVSFGTCSCSFGTNLTVLKFVQTNPTYNHLQVPAAFVGVKCFLR
jgi:hypothetical protein